MKKLFYIFFGVLATIILVFLGLILCAYSGVLSVLAKPLKSAEYLLIICGKMQDWVDKKKKK